MKENTANKISISFSEKQRIVKECEEWLVKSGVESTPFNIITFLCMKGYMGRGYLKEGYFNNDYGNKRKEVI